MQCLSIAYKLWIEEDRVLTKALLCHERVVYQCKAALKQAG